MPKKILLVDDESQLLAMMTLRLNAKGYEVIAAADGNEALEKVREQQPDLVVLDVMMPKLDGFHVCRMIKFDEKTQNIPVIILTAKSQKEDQDIGKDVKADAYLTKPFDSQVLLEKIENLLKNK